MSWAVNPGGGSFTRDMPAVVGTDAIPDRATNGYGDLCVFERSNASESATAVIGAWVIRYFNPTANSSTVRYGGVDGTAAIPSTSSANITTSTGGLYGGGFAAVHDGTGTVTLAIGGGFDVWVGASSKATNVYRVWSEPDGLIEPGSTTLQVGFYQSKLQHAATNVGMLLEGCTGTGLWLQEGLAQFDGDLGHSGSHIGFYGATVATKQTVSGSKASNAALASLITALATYGLVVDATT